MDWIVWNQKRDRRRAVVNAVMNFGLNKMRGISWLAEDVLAYQEEVFSMELLG